MARTPTPAKPRGKTGPKPLLNEAILEQLLEARRRGLPLVKAAKWAGISYPTLYNWTVRGRSALERPASKWDPFDKKCVEMVRLLDKVEAEWIMRCEQVLALAMETGAGRDAWSNATPDEKDRALKTAMWKLSHQAPEDYSTQQRTELTGADGGPVDVALSLEDVWEIMADARKAEKEED